MDIIEEPAQRREVSVCISILAGLLHKPNVINQLFREENMQESLFYQEIIQKGVQKGIQQGLQQGQKQEALSMTMRLLRRRIGEISPTTEERIRALSLSQLEDLGEALLDFSAPTDLTAWLDNLE